MAVTFDLFGTLVSVDRPAGPAAAIAAELTDRGVSVPEDWEVAYREPHVDAPEGAEVALPAHVTAALASRGIEAERALVTQSVSAAFDPVVETRPGALDAVRAARERGPVGVLSNVSVPGLAAETLRRSKFEVSSFDAVVTSVGCGFRKPDRRAFEAVADALGVPVSALVHVGDDPRTDGGAAAVGATAVLTSDVPLGSFSEWLAETEPSGTAGGVR